LWESSETLLASEKSFHMGTILTVTHLLDTIKYAAQQNCVTNIFFYSRNTFFPPPTDMKTYWIEINFFVTSLYYIYR